MKKFVSAAASMCFACVAFAGSPAAAPVDPAQVHIKVLTEFYKGKERVYSNTETVLNGQTFDVNESEAKKGAPDPEKGVLTGSMTPRMLSTGQIRIVSKIQYNELNVEELVDAEGRKMGLPVTSLFSTEPQFNATSGKPVTAFTASNRRGEYRLVVTATKIE